MRKNYGSQIIGAQMVSASDGSAFTGSVTCYVTGDGGTQAIGSVGSGACVHEGNGFHSYQPAQAETNHEHVAFTFIGMGAVPVTIQVYTWDTISRTVNVGLLDGDDAPTRFAGIVDEQIGDEFENYVPALETTAQDILAILSAPIDANTVQISGDTTAAENARSFFDGNGYGSMLLRRTISDTPAPTTTDFTILGGGDNEDHVNGCTIVIRKNGSTVWAVRTIIDSTDAGGNLSVTIDSSPGFLPEAGDIVEILAPGFSQTDRVRLTLAHAKLPSKSYMAGTNNADGDIQINEATGNFPGTIAGIAGAITTLDALDTAQDAQHSATQGRLPASLVGGKIDANVGAISGDAAAADNAEKFFDGTGFGVHLLRTSINSVDSNTEFEVDDSPGNTDSFEDCRILLHQGSNRYLGYVTNINGAGIITVAWSNTTPTLAISNVVEFFLPDMADQIKSANTSAATIAAKLPSKPYLAGTSNADGDIQLSEATGNFPGTIGGIAGTITTLDDLDATQDAQHATTQTSANAAATQATAAATSAATIENKLPSKNYLAGTDNPTGDIEVEGDGAAIPVNQVPVPVERTWILKATSDGLKGELPLNRVAGENQPFAIDFRNDLPVNGRLTSLDDIVVVSGPSGGIEISDDEDDRGVDRAQVKCKINLVEAGTFEIVCAVSYDDSDGGGTSEGVVTLVVRPSSIP
jgi:hypothetical protein